MTDDAEAPAPEEAVRAQARARTRRSFLVGGAAALAGWGLWRWTKGRRLEDGRPWPVRQVLRGNEELARDYFRKDRRAPEFDPSRAAAPRINGGEGMSPDFDPSTWALTLEGVDTDDGTRTLSLADIRALPRHEQTTELKCIEGWSVVVSWAGARLADFIAKYPPAVRGDERSNDPAAISPYVALETPDGGYYVGLDMESALQPQTFLCYEMNGKPLSPAHGAPLRLVIPVKYGIKNIKRIGTIRYTQTRPADFWAERGYDWYAGM
jgi:DMSO/TMAO reductase YedYZ molybdopterin-dependent catalytic subunit